MANSDTTRFYVKDSEIVSVVERLLANIKKEISGIGGGSSPDYTALLTAIEEALNSPNPNIPITDINAGDYNSQPLQGQQYQNTQYLKAILATIGQATSVSPTGITLMGFIETIIQQYFLGVLINQNGTPVPNSSIALLMPSTYLRTLIVHNRGTSNLYMTTDSPATTNGIMIAPSEKLILHNINISASGGNLYFISDSNTIVHVHTIGG